MRRREKLRCDSFIPHAARRNYSSGINITRPEETSFNSKPGVDNGGVYLKTWSCARRPVEDTQSASLFILVVLR